MDDIDYLVGAATPHFAYQIRARVKALVADLPPGHPVRAYAEEKIAHARPPGPRVVEGRGGRARAARTRVGWASLPSHAPASAPHPPAS